jgi:hypothetical protein
LQKLQVAIGIDARFLLKTARFQDFFEKHLNIEPRSNRDRTTKVDDIVANWSLARFDRPLRVFGYKEKFEPDDYDDENTYASYSFNVKVAWDEITKEIGAIQTIGIHGFNNYRHESFVDLAESISWHIEDFPNNADPANQLLSKEFSYLILYCCMLLAQKPSTIEFNYRLKTECLSHKIELGVETMYPTYNENRRYFLDDLDSIKRLKAIFPDLKWVLDLAHLNLWRLPDGTLARSGRLEAIDLIKDRLLEIHLSDNDGRRDLHTAISEKTWWLPHLEILPVSIPYVLETRLGSIRSFHSIANEYQRVVNLL